MHSKQDNLEYDAVMHNYKYTQLWALIAQLLYILVVTPSHYIHYNLGIQYGLPCMQEPSQAATA